MDDFIHLFHDVFNKLRVPNFKIRINHRKILLGLSEILDLKDKFIDLTVILDKIDKMGIDKVVDEVLKIGLKSSLKPTLIDNILFTVSEEGYLFLIEKNNGNIIRTTDLFENFKIKKRKSIKPTGFILGKDKIYLSTDNGRLLVVDISTGKTISILKIDSEKILRPKILNEKLFIVKNNSIIKLN